MERGPFYDTYAGAYKDARTRVRERPLWGCVKTNEPAESTLLNTRVVRARDSRNEICRQLKRHTRARQYLFDAFFVVDSHSCFLFSIPSRISPSASATDWSVTTADTKTIPLERQTRNGQNTHTHTHNCPPPLPPPCSGTNSAWSLMRKTYTTHAAHVRGATQTLKGVFVQRVVQLQLLLLLHTIPEVSSTEVVASSSLADTAGNGLFWGDFFHRKLRNGDFDRDLSLLRSLINWPREATFSKYTGTHTNKQTKILLQNKRNEKHVFCAYVFRVRRRGCGATRRSRPGREHAGRSPRTPPTTRINDYAIRYTTRV